MQQAIAIKKAESDHKLSQTNPPSLGTSPSTSLSASKQFKLFDFQKRCVADVYTNIRANQQRILLIADCGSGKTAIASKIMHDAIFKAKNGSIRCLFLVDLDCLVRQTIEDLQRVGITAGVLQSKSRHKTHDMAIVVSLQTLQSRLKQESLDSLFGKVGIIIADEAHDTAYRKCYAALDEHYLKTGTVFIGLTATPERLSAKQHLGQWFDATVEAPQSPELIKLGRSVVCRAFGAGSVFDVDALKTDSKGDYQEGQMGAQASQKASLKCVVDKYREYCLLNGDTLRPALAFCATVDQAEQQSDAFIQAGIPAECQSGKTKISDRVDQAKRINEGKTLVLCTVGTATKGFDCPIISCILFVRATRSRALFFQAAGRGARTHATKDNYLLLDFGGNLTRKVLTPSGFRQMGNPTGRKVYDISEKKRWGKNSQMDDLQTEKECPTCGFINTVFARVCGACGYEFSPDLEDEEPEDVDLVEFLDKDDHLRRNELRDRKKKCFKLGISPDIADADFVREWGYIAPREWHLNAVLGSRPTERQKQEFQYYLNRHAKHNQWLSWHQRLEFGFGDKPSRVKRDRDPWWKVLEVHPACDRATAKQAYLDLARYYHPDISGKDTTKEMKIINCAWDAAIAHFAR